MDAQPLGRWIAPDTIVPDPADPQSLNRYGYVLNNPLRYTDPSGHCPFCIPIQQCFAGGPCQQVTNQLAQGAQSVWTQVQQLTVQYGPQVSNFIVQLVNQYANQAAAAADGVRGPAGNAGNTAGPGGLDPNNWGPLQEQIVRESLARNYQQVYGTSDTEIRQGLGLQGKIADFVGYNSQQGRWLIAESKGSDMYKAVEQLQNTMQGVINKAGATTSNVDLRIYTNAQSYQRLLTTTPIQGGWTVQNGVLGWWGETNQFVPMIINGVQVIVSVMN